MHRNTLAYCLVRAMHNRHTRQQRTAHTHVHPTSEKCACDLADNSKLAIEQQARMNAGTKQHRPMRREDTRASQVKRVTGNDAAQLYVAAYVVGCRPAGGAVTGGASWLWRLGCRPAQAATGEGVSVCRVSTTHAGSRTRVTQRRITRNTTERRSA